MTSKKLINSDGDGRRKESPRLKSNFISKWLFLWVFKVIKVGHKKELELEDVYLVQPEDSTRRLGDQADAAWEKELNREDWTRPPSLFRAMCRVFMCEYVWLVFWGTMASAVCKIAQSVCLGYLLNWFNGEFYTEFGYFVALGIILATIGYSLFFQPVYFNSQVLGLRIRVALCSLIYKKALRLSQRSLGTSNTGLLTNLISNDVNRFDRYTIHLPYLFVSPIQLIAVTVTMYFYMGVSTFAGVGFLLLLTPLQGMVGYCFGVIRQIVAGKTDVRVRLMSEIVNGILLLKMFTWEDPYTQLVTKARKEEVNYIRGKSALDGLDKASLDTASKLVVLLTLLVFVFTGNSLTASQVFVTLSLYDAVRLPVSIFFPMGITGFSEILVSLKRIQAFLMMEERTESSLEEQRNGSGREGRINMKDFSASWGGKGLTLNKVNIEAGPGQLWALIGPVGSGKTSVLYGILKELPAVSGTVRAYGKIAYASQEPWLYTGSVRENILFGLPYRHEWYQKVIEACSMNRDISLFTFGDKTLVGEKGMALSGGQKARINLARAVYADADIVLLDDPLSAVDARVGRHIFEHCIMGLLKDKCVVLVTHQVQFLEPAHEILVIREGHVANRGDFAHLVAERELSSKGVEDEVPIFAIDDVHAAADPIPPLTLTESSGSSDGSGAIEKKYGTFDDDGGPKENKEQRSLGYLDTMIYWKFFRAGNSIFTLFCFLLFMVLAQAAINGSDYWLRIWTDKETEPPFFMMSNGTIRNAPATFLGLTEMEFIEIYCGIVVLIFIFSAFKLQLHYYTCLNSATSLHSSLFNAIIRAPMYFFETNSAGRVLNRCVNDVGAMDENIPQLMAMVLGVIAGVIGSLVIICIEQPLTALPAIVVLAIFYLVRRFYLKASSSLKRLETVARSPVFGHMSTSLLGLTTIRAYKAEANFRHQFCVYQDVHSAAYYLTVAAQRWIGVMLDWISNIYFILVVLSFFFIPNSTGASVGLAISSAMFVVANFSWGIGQSAELENQFVSVERVMDFAKTKPEAPLRIPDKQPPNDWPTDGNIRFEDVYVRYQDNPPVLRGICVNIRPREKVGIVGRTGAGKSSFISCLFRIVEPCDGSILIDNVDILDMGLHDLRSRIGIIPQDSVLFIGTLRRNLDPATEYTDLELWTVLGQVQLAKRISDMSDSGLDTQISEGGSNFSLGERQLICLARALLRRLKVIVLDEATAHIDTETDDLIQHVIRENFANSTVLTIAHRLDTVMDSDRICVIDSGRVLEFEEPYVLLQNESGWLSQLVSKTGKVGSAILTDIAKKAYERRRRQ